MKTEAQTVKIEEKLSRKDKGNGTFYISLALTLSIVLWGLFLPQSFERVGNATFGFLVTNFGWFYTLSMSTFVIFCICLAMSKYGKIRLGADNSKPEYSYISWFAMLFSAGMGIGLVFWGVAEPLNHYLSPMAGIDGGSAEAAEFAIRKSFLHWGLHPWANYSVLALGLAYMQFRKNKPGLISSIFIPLIGEKRVKGPIGKTVDVLAIFATVAGVATSLGLGTYQINSGLNYLFGVPENGTVQIIIVVVVTAAFMLSAVTGLDKGIKLLSNLNVGIGGVLLLISIIVGPTLLIMNTFVDGIGIYLSSLPGDSFAIGAFSKDPWYGSWSIFYWSWWIAWAPFSAAFIARISKGRTIKEFITGVLLAPTFAGMIWFSVFGAMGINKGPEVAGEAIKSTSTAFFVLMDTYPMGGLISFVTLILICTFFVTSADSATFVLGMMSSNGDLNPTTKRKVIWGAVQSLMALALMLGSVNGLQMLQTVSIAAAFPFAFIMILCMISLIKMLKSENI